MPNSDKNMQDHRENSGMEDSNAMTIEFLRARLLSERSVSKSARQRADELARRVAELEEQLKIVSLQRKKAEKANADVLAILENNGMGEISDALDSSSDQETPCESEMGNNFNKVEENSVDSKFRRNESVELSGSDNDFSPVPRRGLSWNGRRGTKQSLEKCKDSYLRRSSFASTGSSSAKNRVGKSCRQIRRRESKSVVEEVKTDPVKVDCQENGVATSVQVGRKPEILRGSEAQDKIYLGEALDSGCFENEKMVTNSDVDFNGCGGDKDMEKALEDQAQFIGRYEEMEKAQREWEERFGENNSGTPDSCDPGNQSDVTEERDEIKAQVQFLAGTVNSQVQEAKSEVYVSENLSKTQSNGFLPTQGDMQPLRDERCGITPASGSLAQGFTFPTSNEKQNQGSLDNNHEVPSHNSHQYPVGSPGNQSSQVVSSNTGGSSGKEVSGSQNDHHALVPHETSSGFREVLEALRQARLSLQQKMSSLPLTENESVGKAIESFLPAGKVSDKVEIPVGYSGLFRVPTDYALEVSKAHILVSGSQPSLGNFNPTTGGLGEVSDDKIFSNPFMDTRSTFSADNFRPSGDQFLTRPNNDTRSSYSTEDRLRTSQYADTRSRISPMRPSIDSSLDAGLLSSRQYSYPNVTSYHDLMSRLPRNERFSPSLESSSVQMSPNLDVGLSSSSRYANPNFSAYPDLMPRIPTREGFSTLRSSGSGKTLPANHMPFHNDHTRPYIYR